MRTEVKIGIAVGVIVAIVAVLYVVFHEPAPQQGEPADANAGQPSAVAVIPGGDDTRDTLIPGFGRGTSTPPPERATPSPVGPAIVEPDEAPPMPVAMTPAPTTQPIEATGPLAIKPALATRPAPAIPRTPAATAMGAYTVQKGDMGFWTVAEKVYGKGKGKYWPLIAKANPDVDSNKLQVGMKLKIPPLPEMPGVSSPAVTTPGTPAVSPAGKTYTVQRGDSWWSISKAHYGNGKYHPALRAANPHIKGTLQPGQKIRIPPLASLQPAGPVRAPAAPTPVPATPAAPPDSGDDRPIFD